MLTGALLSAMGPSCSLPNIVADVARLHVTSLESIAAVIGVVSVYLSTRQNVWSWPTGLINVVLYSWIFWHARLYADAGLQVVYALFSVYGWHQWLYGGTGRVPLPVSRAGWRLWTWLAPLTIAVAVISGVLFRRYTNNPAPFADSALTATSLAAQWLLTRKVLENWLIWIFADLVYVGLFWQRGLCATAAQYLVFLILAIKGYIDWRLSMRDAARSADLLAT